MRRAFLVFQIWILVGQILAISTQYDGVTNAAPHGQLAITPLDRTSVSAQNRKHSEASGWTQTQNAITSAGSLTPVAASMANAEKVVKEIPDKNMEVTVVKPNDVEKERFTMADVIKEELADTTNLPNIIDDYDLGPNASF